MILLGVIANTAAIIAGALLGRFGLHGLNERFKSIIQHSQGLFIVFIGVSGALAGKNILLLVLSMLIGSVIGEIIDIDKRMHRASEWMGKRLGMDKKAFSKAFVASSVLFCAGSMAVIGPIQSGLSGDHTMLFMKAILDGTFALFMASTLGVGVLFSCIPVLIYEGAIAIGAGFISTWLEPEIIAEMSAAGSILLIGIGFNLVVETKIKIANMVPAIFLPWPLMELYELLPL